MNYYPQGLEKVEGELKRKRNDSGDDAVMSSRSSHKETLITHTGYPNSIIKFDIEMNEKRHHPTQKPVSLFEYLIRTYTNEGDIVLDNCMGSGTTAVAALNTNRKFIGFETEPAYIEIANKRIDDLSK